MTLDEDSTLLCMEKVCLTVTNRRRCPPLFVSPEGEWGRKTEDWECRGIMINIGISLHVN